MHIECVRAWPQINVQILTKENGGVFRRVAGTKTTYNEIQENRATENKKKCKEEAKKAQRASAITKVQTKEGKSVRNS